MSTPKENHWEMLGNRVVEALKKNNFQAEYVKNREEAKNRLLELIPPGATIGKGGSVTVTEIGIMEELKKRGHEIFDHNVPNLTPQEKNAIRHKQLSVDCFLSSTNALTESGKLVNIDGSGNRVAAMIFGPKKVFIVAGINKITKDIDSAVERIAMWAAPPNNMRLNYANPCAKTGVCMDCQGPTRICNVTTIMHKKPSLVDITVILVGEELGY